jgi:hypothetical protein
MILTIILIVIVLVVVLLGFRANAEARAAAEYEVRREHGELTPEEIRAEAMEERANYESRTSAKDSVIW